MALIRGERMKIKVKDIPNGSILWKGNTILGVKGANLDEKYYDYECYQEQGNPLDYTIITNKKLRELKNEILKGDEERFL